MAILIIIAQNLEEGDSRGDFLISSTLFFVVFFALGNGSIPWLITGEMFTQGEAAAITMGCHDAMFVRSGSRSAASSVVVFINWSANLTVRPGVVI